MATCGVQETKKCSTKCILCSKSVLEAHKYRLLKATRSNGREKTRVYNSLLSVTTTPEVFQSQSSVFLESACLCKPCCKFVYKVEAAKQQLYMLVNELQAKINNNFTASRVDTGLRVTSSKVCSTMQLVASHNENSNPAAEPMADVSQQALDESQDLSITRNESSPPRTEHFLSTTGFQSTLMKRPLDRSPASSGVTPPCKRSYGHPKLKPLQPKPLRQTFPVVHSAATVRRSLFAPHTDSAHEQTAVSEQQVYKVIPTYNSLEDDPEEDYKVRSHFVNVIL